MYLGERPVGTGAPVLIVAEAGVNHDGSVEKALQMVEAAASVGADVVKFQMFRADDLTTASAPLAEYQKATGAVSQREMLRRLELSDDDFARVAEYCRVRRIEFLATPFSPRDVDRLVGLGVRAIKIASPDLTNVPLLQHAAQTGLPLIVSTGAALPEEIEATVHRLRRWGVLERVILLHCVSGYPAPLEAANLRAINTLRSRFGVPCGFSDHTRSREVAGWAVAAGACVLEKHFTLDPRAPGPDHAMSLDPVQLGQYIACARRAETALGHGRIGMSSLEADVRTAARKSVVAAEAIPAGTTITGPMLTLKRPGGGIAPERLDEIIGRRAAVDIPADTLLSWEMLR